MYRKLSVVALATIFATASQAAPLFSGLAFFSQGPFTQMGGINGSLSIVNLPNGFNITGNITINTGPGFVGGTLLSWTVDRPLDPSYGTGILSTTTYLFGFSQPPSLGTFGNTSGISQSEFTNFVGPSTSTIPLNLTAGAQTWNNIFSSGPFVYTSGGTNYLRQRFDLDGIQLSGPGGNWVVDVPLTTTVDVVPEPTSLAAIFAGIGAFAIRRRRA